MAVIHIKEAEAARDFSALMDRVGAGEELWIERDNGTIALLRPMTKPRTASEIIARMKKRGPALPADPGFADDIEDGMRIHRAEERFDPWE